MIFSALLRNGSSKLSLWRQSGSSCLSAGTHRAYSTPLQVSVDVLDGDLEGVSVLQLQRPDARNALGRQLITELIQCLDTIRQEKSTRVLLIKSSVVGVFSAGADLKERATMSLQEAQEFVMKLRSTFSTIQNLSMPTVALLQGPALGGGAELALACDFRVCSSSTRFAWPETRLGIIPGAGGTQRLPRLIGPTRAKELIFTGRNVDAQEALSLGLACKVLGSETEAEEAARKLAGDIAASAPVALRMAKAAIDDGFAVDLATGLKIEEHCYSQTLRTDDRWEGLRAFKEKRKPVFTGA